ncbi:hypothetical protein ACFFKU_17595 [Kineococcus gynurae]|uniref:Acetyltransferase (GNAT) family protein n=1 Tax=Kineococcus gynurae TaxID=452979 RepID=A0ABV5LNP4_9ACTN
MAAVVERFRAGSTEAALASFLGDYREHADARGTGVRSAPAFVRAQPLRTVLAAVAVVRLPGRRAVLPGPPLAATADARQVREVLGRRLAGIVPVGLTGTAVLDVPADAEEYLEGNSRQTLRRKLRAATKKGVSARVVRPGERETLLARARAAEQAHPDERYRSADPDLADLPDYQLWLVAERDGEPLMLAVLPHAGEWAVLRHFRTIGTGPAHSDARYLMAVVAVRELSARGVRHLADTVPATHLPNGLRHFQRMIGFRYVRVRLAR